MEPTHAAASSDDRARLEAFRAALDAAARQVEQPRFLALTHTSPDPDALGALAGMRLLLQEGFGYGVRIATLGSIHRAENQAMVRELSLELSDWGALDPSLFCGSILVDSQPGFGHTQLPATIPLLAVFDHHRSPEDEGGVDRLGGVPHVDVRESLGATSSLIWLYLLAAGVELDAITATALFCGVRYDTGDLSYNVSPEDEQAWYETFRAADRKRVARIDRPQLPPVYYAELRRSLELARRYGSLVICTLGPVHNPESVAEMADFFLRLDGCRWSLVGGAYDGTYHVSLRTRFGWGDAYPLLRRVLDREGSFGGHGRVAGGQVPLGPRGAEGVPGLEQRLLGRALDVLAEVGELDGGVPGGEPLA